MKHTVALSGSYYGDSETLFKNLHQDGIIHTSLVGREIIFQVRSEKLEEIKRDLGRLGVSNINILEWKKIGMTLSNSGRGSDNNEIIEISLIPTAMGEGFRQLAVLSEFDIDKELLMKIRYHVIGILRDAGITDIIYTIRIGKRASEEEYLDAAAIATLNAIFDSGGVVSVD